MGTKNVLDVGARIGEASRQTLPLHLWVNYHNLVPMQVKMEKNRCIGFFKNGHTPPYGYMNFKALYHIKTANILLTISPNLWQNYKIGLEHMICFTPKLTTFHEQAMVSVTRKKSPNVDKSCLKMISVKKYGHTSEVVPETLK